MRPEETSGRFIAQQFFSELEKIAKAGMVLKPVEQMMAERAEALGHANRAGQSFGWQRFVPFTNTHRAWRAARQKGHQRASSIERAIGSRRQLLEREMQGGTKRTQAKAMDQLDRYNKAGAPSGGGAMQKVREYRRFLGLESPPPEPPPSGMSPVRKAALVAGGTAGLAGVGYAGAQYMSRPTDPYAGM